MNKLKYLAAVLVAVAGLGLQQAQADLLAPVQFFTPTAIGSGTDENTFLQGQGLLPATSQFLGKFDAATGFEAGAIPTQFFTINQISGNTWEITWDLTGTGFTLDGVLIKDGAVDQQQLYRFYGVTDEQEVVGSGTVTFDNPIRDISHISFFGSPGGNGVPDGGTTVMLLGAALGSLGMARRFLKR